MKIALRAGVLGETDFVLALAKEGCQPPAWGAAVAFPDTDFDNQPAQDDVRGVALGGNHLPYLGEALPGIVERALPPPAPAVGDWMSALGKLWGEAWVPTLSLGSRVKAANAKILSLDNGQLMALDLLADQERALILGGAGTGKTLLAVHAALRQAAAGRSVLLLCSTQPLQHWLSSRLRGSGVQVATVSALAKSLVDGLPGSPAAEPSAGAVEWTTYFERACDVQPPHWDTVVIDEAQDFPFEAWAFVQGLSEGRRLWAFLDPEQRYWPDREPPAELFGPPFRLPAGHRSTPAIEAFAGQFIGKPPDPAVLRRGLATGELQVLPHRDAASPVEHVVRAVDRLRGDGLALSDIGVVSLRGQGRADAVHHHRRLGPHEVFRADAPGMEEGLVADSFLRWKGLERAAIIVADVDPSLERFDTRMHIALTRALAAVRVVAAKGVVDATPSLRRGLSE